MKLIDAGDYLGASEEVMKSKWAKQQFKCKSI